MEITVKSKYLRISPRKVRPVLYGLRGMTAQQAAIVTKFVNKKGAKFILGLIKSGIAAARENYLDADKVLIKEIACNEGPMLKRMIPWSKGQGRRIKKRMAHITLTLESTEQPKNAKSSKESKDNNTEEAK